ncbi:MAG: tetratricopeptide repeat protein, partial [Bacteroidetes bacterium]|nr:tetratricopeptide repeat protein [Bacteroidota bacterium]
RLPEVRKQQAELAGQYGIEGFCYWHYWFNGKQLLERPIQDVLESGEPDFPFCLAWANEHWSRRWNGMEQDILQEQIYGGKEDDEAHIQWLISAFQDKRYITVDGKPLFLIYNPSHLPDPLRTITLWHTRVKEAGLPGIYLVAIKSHTKSWEKNWKEFGFDNQLIFQPNWGIIRKYSELIEDQYLAPPIKSLENIDPLAVNYSEAWKYLAAFQGEGDEFHSVVPMWDNSARRKYQPVILDNPSPEEYKRWLALEIVRVKGKPPSDRIVFLNAWNEWAEGNHLEPDQKFGHTYLEATKEALQTPSNVVVEAYCDLALAVLRFGAEKLSQEFLKRAQELSDPQTIQNFLQPKLGEYNAISKNIQAVTEFQRGNIDEARKILEQTAKQYPDYPMTNENLARVYYEKEEYEKALKILFPLLKDERRTLALSVLEGECQEALGQKDRAISAYLQGCSEINDPYLCRQRIAALVEEPNGDDESKNKFPSTSIIIITYNNLSYTQECLSSVLQYTDTPYELIVIDNNSSDGSQDWLREFAATHNSCQLILNSENLGFPHGINQGLRQAKGEYVVLLNNDTVVTDGWLRNLIKVAQKNQKIGLVGPMTNSISGPQLDKTAWYVTLTHMRQHAKRTSELYRDVIYEATRLRFFCVLITRKALEVCGGLDERFSPGNCEDDDYCLRAQLAGFSVVIARNVFIHHYGSKSFTISGSRNYHDLIEKNKEKFRGKWGIQIEDIGSSTKKVRAIPLKYPINKDDFQESVERAMFHLQCNEFQYAVQWIDRAVTIGEKAENWNEEIIGQEEFYNLAGRVFLTLGNLEQAKLFFEKELQKNPQSSRACTELGRTFYLSELYEASKTMYEWAVIHDPANAKAIKGLATVNEALGFCAEHNSLLQETKKEVSQ